MEFGKFSINYGMVEALKRFEKCLNLGNDDFVLLVEDLGNILKTPRRFIEGDVYHQNNS